MQYHRRLLIVLMMVISCAVAISTASLRADVIGIGSGEFGVPPAGVYHFGATHEDIFGGTPSIGQQANVLSVASNNFSTTPGNSFAAAQLLYFNGMTLLSTS